jgi:hypothetical protein
MSKETFVFEGTEVVKTGREAVREIKSVGGKTTPRKLVLVEITPVDSTFEWRKWVDPSHLFVIGQAE